MEDYHVQRRSASHGSLRSSYKSHGRPPAGFPRSHRPLRSVNENAGLLPSPGPLESMLKTTTETGDIGIFSIKPIAPAATTHLRARSRPGIDASSIFRPESRGSSRTESRISCRRQCSDRDTNSEIISMYGSERTLSPRVASLSPRSGPSYQRSFSLTSNVSRQLPRQRSSSTLRSPSSGGTLQRPRSPFPYPTRLKRPGIRPYSPALTENGHVDYSRMVEIDRISHVGSSPFGHVWRPIFSNMPEEDRSWIVQTSLRNRATPRTSHFFSQQRHSFDACFAASKLFELC